MNILLLFVPLLLSIAHYVGIRYKLHSQTTGQMLQSLAAGLAIAYVFLIVIPEVITFGEAQDFDGMLLVLIGFTAFHVIFKLIVKYSHRKHEKEFLLEELHVASSSLYSLLLTFLIIDFINQDATRGLVLFAVILVHTVLSDISNFGHNKKYTFKAKLLLLITSTMLGGILAIAEIFSGRITNAIFAFAAGAVIYITTREEVPVDSKGFPMLFVFGVIIVAAFNILLGL